jgi:hypothetical protein
MKPLAIALTCGLLTLTASAADSSSPPRALREFQATLAVKYKGMSAGQSQLKLERLGDDRWRYSSISQAHGLFKIAVRGQPTQVSVVQILPDGSVRPLEFISTVGAKASNKDEAMRYDWQAMRVTGLSEGEPVDIALQPGMHDDASVQLALMQELMHGRQPTGFRLVDKTEIKDYIFTHEGEEILDTPLGQQKTVIYRSTRRGSPRSTLYWCAPALGYLPVKVERRYEKKVEFSMALLSATFGADRE